MQQDESFIAFLIIFGIAFFAVIIAISVFVIWFTSSCLQRIPAQFRKQEPGQCWLLLIPCFNLYWNFQVFPKVSESFQEYFRAVRDPRNGDCGASLANLHCILTLCQMIPYLGGLIGLANLVVLIMMLVKFNALKQLIPEGGGGPYGPSGGYNAPGQFGQGQFGGGYQPPGAGGYGGYQPPGAGGYQPPGTGGYQPPGQGGFGGYQPPGSGGQQDDRRYQPPGGGGKYDPPRTLQ